MLINHVWFEGLVTKVHRESQITVAFPGADGADSSEIVVFADSSGDVWAREAFNKKIAKRAGLRRGWAFSGTLSGKWLVRGQACASAVTSDCRDGEASTFLRGEAPRRRGAARPPGDARDAGATYGHGESSPSASFGGDGDGTGPAFKSLSDACHHLLLGAGAAGLQVSTLVRAIQSRNLVKLGGRTPSNTVYSRLSQDARFVNVSRGAYALATVVSGGGTAASTPTKFSAATRLEGGGGRRRESTRPDERRRLRRRPRGGRRGERPRRRRERERIPHGKRGGGGRWRARRRGRRRVRLRRGGSARVFVGVYARSGRGGGARGGRGERRQRGGHGGGTQRGTTHGTSIGRAAGLRVTLGALGGGILYHRG